MAGQRHVRLRDAHDAKNFLCRLINDRNRDRVSSEKCRDLGYLLKIFCEMHLHSELELRLEALEKLMNTGVK